MRAKWQKRLEAAKTVLGNRTVPQIKKLSITLISLLSAFLLAEGAFRQHSFQPKFGFDWVFHPVLGHTGPISTEITDGGAPSKYNEWGFRNDFLQTPPLKSKQHSLLILGDSMTEQNDLPRESLYVSHLRNHFQSRLVTLASADFGTAEAYLALHFYQDKVKPDLIILQFLGLNDFVNNNFHFANRNKSWSDFSRPYLAPPHLKGTEVYDGVPIVRANPFRHWLTTNSKIFHSYYAWKTARKWALLDFPIIDCPPEIQMFLKNPTEEWKLSIDSTEKLLREIKRKAGQTLVVGVYFPSNIEVTEKIWKEGLEPQLKRCFPGEEYGKNLGEEKFLKLARAAGLDLAFSIRERFENKVSLEKREATLYIPGGHFSPLGHSLAAEAILEKITKSE